jgi:hypothetical protein
LTLAPDECAFPPHPGDDGDDADAVAGEWRDGIMARMGEWRRESPLPRTVPFAAPVVWGAAEILNALHVAAWQTGAGAGLATGIAAWAAARHYAADENRVSGGEAAITFGLPAAWLTAASAAGPLAGGFPWWWTTAGLALAAGLGRWLGGHRSIAARYDAEQAEAVRLARRIWWNSEIAPLLGLSDYYLQDWQPTLLGETVLVRAGSVHARRASEIWRGRAPLMETLCLYLGLPYGSCDMDLTDRPGELVVRIRRGDPWAEPVWHPAVRAGSPYAYLCPEEGATIREPVCIGVDPETGRPLLLSLWDKRGGKVIAVFAKKEAGKTTLLDSITERITACDDARLLQINLSKALEDSWWAELADANALDLDLGRAFGILRFASDAIRERPRGGKRRVKVHQPTPGAPLYVLKIDEIDAAVDADPVRAKRLLGLICGKCRSEGITVLLATQRGIQQVIGGGMVQMNIDIVIWGKFARASELANVAGREANLPDIGEYGGGAAGVFGITELPHLGEYQRGRTFYWGETDEGHRAVVERRRERRRAHQLEPALAALGPQWDRITSAGEYDWQADPEYAADLDGSTWGGGPAQATAGGDAVPSAAALRERAADLAGTAAPEIRELDELAEARLRQRVAAEREAWLAAYTDVDIPPADLKVIVGLLQARDVVSSQDVADAIRKSRPTAHRYLTRMVQAGHAELIEGRGGRAGGFRAPARPDGQQRRVGDAE